MLIITFFAFLSGIITILSPCILPVLPIVLSGSIGGKSKPLGVITGFIGSFSLFTLVLSTIVQLFKIDSQILRIFALVVIIAFGLTLIIPVLKHYFEIGISKLVKTNGKKQKKGFAGGIMLGASLGLIWTPCVGPIMASVISLAVSQQVDGGSVIIVLAYSIGTSIPLFGIMLGGQKMLTSLPWLKNNSEKVQRFFGVVMILVGISIGLGLDRQFQSSILNAFPNYGETITAIENNEIISEALNIRGKEKSNDKSLNWDNPPKNARLGNWGEAPEIVTKGEWINTLAPLTMNDLKGKVVLLDFWTYSCVNCVRTIPYLSNLYSKYKDDGFTIIGVHSPEFTFERDLGNVKKAVEDLGIDWPVVLDNNFQQWRAYNNSYWPAHFFIDANGQIRYFHFGEGSYKESEEVVQKLLKEAGQKIKVHSEIDKVTWTKNITPETYLGYGRLDNFASINEIKKEFLVTFDTIKELKTGEWDISGDWIVREDFIQTSNNGILQLKYFAKDLFLVIEPLESGTSIDIQLDGTIPTDTSDVKFGKIKPKESRLYHLIQFSEPKEHLLKLETNGGVRLYAFTFG